MSIFRFSFILLFSFLAIHDVLAYSPKKKEYDPSKKKKYHVAVHATNPLSGMIKYGGAFETRTGKIAYVASYIKYISAYAGKQGGMELDRYFKSKTDREFFMYARGTFGLATFDSKKLSIYGEKTDIVIYDVGYAGIALGFGKRYNYTAFFLRWNIGVKYCPILSEGMTEPQINMYRLFHTTGPGSMIEVNFRLGIQL